MAFTSYNELQSIIYKKLALVADDIAQELLKLLQAQIDGDVYNPFAPTMYERQPSPYSFRDAWDEKAKFINKGGEAEIKYAPEKMSLDINNYVHGSPYSGDSREYLASIIFDGLAGELFAPGQSAFWKNSRPAWYNWLQELSDGYFAKVAKDKLIKHGFALIV